MSSVADGIQGVHERLLRSAAEARFSGAVLTAVGDEVVFSQGYGRADRDAAINNTPTTSFRVASLGKMFTAVAVLQLQAEGHIRLDAPLATYLPGRLSLALGKTVTLEQVLTHTGGAGEVFGREFVEHREELREVGDYLELFEDRAPEFAPGTQFRYSNFGYILLGAVIEAVSARPYRDYVREYVFEPAGMDGSGFPIEAAEMPGVAIGYRRTPAGLEPDTATLPVRGTPAGGAVSTVMDLFRFARALQQGRLLDADAVQRMTAGRVEFGPDLRYACGFVEWMENGTRSYGNLGSAPGMSGALRIAAQGDWTVAVLSNRDPPTAQIAQQLVYAHLYREL